MWHERISPPDPSSPNLIGWGKEREIEREKKEKRERRDSRERSSTFSLEFPAIRQSVFGEARSKVAPHCKSYTWAPVLRSFDNSER